MVREENNNNNKHNIQIRLLSILLVIIMLIGTMNLTTVNVKADIGGEENTGGGTGTGGTNASSTWSGASQSGYRITMVDDDLIPVVPPVDWLFKAPPASGIEEYGNARTESHQLKKNVLISWDIFSNKTGKKPPVPISVSGTSYAGQGEAFKKWFLGNSDTVVVGGGAGSGGGGTTSPGWTPPTTVVTPPTGGTPPSTKVPDLGSVSASSILMSEGMRNSVGSSARSIVLANGWQSQVASAISTWSTILRRSINSFIGPTNPDTYKAFYMEVASSFNNSTAPNAVKALVYIELANIVGSLSSRSMGNISADGSTDYNISKLGEIEVDETKINKVDDGVQVLGEGVVLLSSGELGSLLTQTAAGGEAANTEDEGQNGKLVLAAKNKDGRK